MTGVQTCALPISLTLDDDLLAKAMKLSGTLDRTALISASLQAFIQQESAKRLAKLGGSQPALAVAPRRRGKASR